MNVIFYTNCQYAGIQYFLDHYYSTQGTNVHYTHLENYTLIRDGGEIDDEVLSLADIFIYQPIGEEHGIYSTDTRVAQNIQTRLRDDCIRIAFPYIYNSALWPFLPPATIDRMIGGFGSIEKYINEEPICDLVHQGWSLREIIRAFFRNEIEFNYQQRYQNCMRILREKEQLCDVQVSDFIDANIRKRRLFLTQNHPTSALFIHCTHQVLKILGEECHFNVDNFPENVAGFSRGWPQSDSAEKAWGFTYRSKYKKNRFYRKHITRIYQNHLYSYIQPLSYSIPEKCLLDDPVSKTRTYAKLVPRKLETYIYSEQSSYFRMYQEAMFGYTYRKGGWDCLRHYEIIANKSIPYFVGLENCPEHSLASMPKELILSAMKALDEGRLTAVDYTDYVERLSEHAKQHMTCRQSAESVIAVMVQRKYGENASIDPEQIRVLMINVGGLNYSRELLSIGLRQVLGNRFVDYPRNSFLYDEGESFMLSGQIEDEGVERDDIKSRLKQRDFDFVLFANVDDPPKKKIRQMPFWRLLRKHYARESVAFIFGGDRPPFSGSGLNSASDTLKECLEFGMCFVREFGDDQDAIDLDASWQEFFAIQQAKWERIIEDIDSSERPDLAIEPFEV